MKIPRLPEIDLARCAALPPGELMKRELRHFNQGGGGWSYEPNRRSICDILSAKTPLLGLFAPVSWTTVSEQINRACNKGVKQSKSNIEVAKVLFDNSRNLGWSAANVDMGSLPVHLGGGVRYWSDVVVEDQNGLFIPFFDHRRRGGIENAAARQIVFSMQHVGVRERNPDLMDARLAIVRFPSSGDKRDIRIYFHSESDLLSYDELNDRVRVVYETWAQVSEECTDEARRTGTTGTTPFGF